jgi:hypothetical protein
MDPFNVLIDVPIRYISSRSCLLIQTRMVEGHCQIAIGCREGRINSTCLLQDKHYIESSPAEALPTGVGG